MIGKDGRNGMRVYMENKVKDMEEK